FGQFSNDPSLTLQEIATLSSWCDSGRLAGDPRTASRANGFVEGWNIPQPDLVVKMPSPVTIPVHGDVEYTYVILPTGLTEDRWVQNSEVRPSSRQHVHHAVVYIRPPGATWLRHAPVGVPFTASTLTDPKERHQAHWTDSDMLLVYAPG